MTDKKLQIIPLGGLGEFGMNMTAIRYGDDIIVIDSGMMFPEDELPGVDLVMPDITFLKENREQVRALILTHGHEDHIGAVPFLLSELNVPVYGTDFTIALVERRLEEYDLEEVPHIFEVKPKQILEIASFKIEFIHVTHSIVNAVALAITTPLGVVIHTGDFKVDPTPPTTNCSTCTRWRTTANRAFCCCCRILQTRTAPAIRNRSGPSGPAWKNFSAALPSA